MLDDGSHDAYVVDARWGDSKPTMLTLDIAITQGEHRGELVTFSIPAEDESGEVSEQLRSVCAHFALGTPETVPDTDLELILLAMPCTLVAQGGRIGFSGDRRFDEPGRPADE